MIIFIAQIRFKLNLRILLLNNPWDRGHDEVGFGGFNQGVSMAFHIHMTSITLCFSVNVMETGALIDIHHVDAARATELERL